MQHEPPTTDRDTLSVGQGDAVSDQVEHRAGDQPSDYPGSHQTDYLTSQPPGQNTDLNTDLNTNPGAIPDTSQVTAPDYPDTGYLPDSIADQTSGMPDLSMLQLEGKKEGALSDYTMQQLQLRSQPFIGASAEGELFADEVTFSQISEIKQAIIKGDTVLLLTGEEGAGKTTLLKQLTRNSGARLQFFSVKGGEKYTTHNLFSGILDAWKLTPPSDFEESAKEMLLALQANHERNTTVVLLLDDADLIPSGELHLLLATVQYFNNSEEPLLRVILSATPEFETRLPQLLPQGLKLPYSAMQVEPLLASRAAPYIQLRLNQAGHFDEFPLSEKQVSAIANDASGYPGRINYLTAETLNQIFSPFADEETSTRSSGGFFAKLANGKGKGAGKAILGLLGIGLIGAGIYKTVIQRQNNDTDPRVADATTTGSASSTANQNSNNNFTTVETRPVTGNSATERAVSQQGNQTSAENQAVAAGNEAVPLQSVSSTAANTSPAASNTGSADNEQTPATAGNAADSGEASPATQTDPQENAAAELKAAADELSVALGTTTTSSTTAANTAAAASTTSAANNEVAAKSTSSEDIADTEQTAATAQSNAQSQSNTETQAGADTSDSTAASAGTESSVTSPPASDDSDAEVPLEPASSTAPITDSNATDEPEAPATNASAADTARQDEAPENQTAPAASSTETAANEIQQAEAEATAEAATEAATGAPDSDEISSLESPNWVLLQNPDLWTIQMSASTDKSDIDRFLRNAGLEGPTSIYSFKRGDVTWYALVQGLYSGLGEARGAIEGMNKAAVKNQPWIRKIGSIQESVKK